MAENTPNPEREVRIMEAAAKLIAHYGYDKTTVSDIAKEAGISKGAVYLHYKSKEELFEALVIYEGLRMLDVVIQRIEADPDAGSIFSLYQHSMVAMFASPLILGLMRQDAKVVGDMARRLKDKPIMAQGNFIRHELVTQLQAVNVIRPDLDAKTITHLLAIIRYGFLMISEVVPPEDSPPLDDVSRAIGQLLDRGLAPESGANTAAGKAVLENILHMMKDMLRQHQEGKA